MESGVAMFIASYATYVPTLSATKSSSTNDNFFPEKNPVNRFEEVLQKGPESSKESTPIVTKYSLFEQAKKSRNIRFLADMQTRQNAKKAYSESLQPFSSMKKPKTPQQKPLALHNVQLPKEAQSARESILKEQMVNTYRENENYYRVTAA